MASQGPGQLSIGESRGHSSTVERYPPAIGKPKHEVRALAKNAILNLLPVKIGFDDFIREGVREDIVKGLFAELRQHPERTLTDNKVASTGQATSQRIEIISNVVDPLPFWGNREAPSISTGISTA